MKSTYSPKVPSFNSTIFDKSQQHHSEKANKQNFKGQQLPNRKNSADQLFQGQRIPKDISDGNKWKSHKEGGLHSNNAKAFLLNYKAGEQPVYTGITTLDTANHGTVSNEEASANSQLNPKAKQVNFNSLEPSPTSFKQTFKNNTTTGEKSNFYSNFGTKNEQYLSPQSTKSSDGYKIFVNDLLMVNTNNPPQNKQSSEQASSTNKNLYSKGLKIANPGTPNQHSPEKGYSHSHASSAKHLPVSSNENGQRHLKSAKYFEKNSEEIAQYSAGKSTKASYSPSIDTSKNFKGQFRNPSTRDISTEQQDNSHSSKVRESKRSLSNVSAGHNPANYEDMKYAEVNQANHVGNVKSQYQSTQKDNLVLLNAVSSTEEDKTSTIRNTPSKIPQTPLSSGHTSEIHSKAFAHSQISAKKAMAASNGANPYQIENQAVSQAETPENLEFLCNILNNDIIEQLKVSPNAKFLALRKQIKEKRKDLARRSLDGTTKLVNNYKNQAKADTNGDQFDSPMSPSGGISGSDYLQHVLQRTKAILSSYKMKEKQWKNEKAFMAREIFSLQEQLSQVLKLLNK